MPQHGRITNDPLSFDVPAASRVASITDVRLEVRGTVLRKACKCTGTSSTGYIEKSKNASGRVSISYDSTLCCDLCGTPWISDVSPGL